MSEQRLQQASSWTRRREEKERRMQAVMRWMSGPVLPTDKTVEAPLKPWWWREIELSWRETIRSRPTFYRGPL
jgi:hypothetical protein